jgi:hypothetical protein
MENCTYFAYTRLEVILVEYFICPSCKNKNEEHKKYCDNCGSWLLSSAYPAKKLEHKAKKRFISSIIPLVLIITIGYYGFSKFQEPSAIKFDSMSLGDLYTISQLTVGDQIAADFTTRADTKDPLEVKAAFYDSSGNRLGVATSLVGHQMAKGQTTTLVFKYDGSKDGIKSVRVEVIPLSPLMLIDKASQK